MLFHVELSVEILNGNVMNIEIAAGSYCANAVKKVFRSLGARQRLNCNIGVGKDVADCGCDGYNKLLRALKSDVAGKADGEVGKIAVASAANAYTPDFQHTIDS